MKISHISVGTLPVLYQFGGAIERRIVELAKEQVKRGHQVDVYSIGDADETRDVDGVRYNLLACRTRLPYRHVEFQYRAIRALTKRSDDVLHFHSQPEGAWLSRSLQARKVLSYDFFAFRGGRRTPLYYVYQRAMRRFDLLLPCSQHCLRESQAFWELPTDNLKVLFNGVSTRQFRPDPEAGNDVRRQMGIDRRVMLYVGRVCTQKGSDVLLEAARLLRERRNDVQLVVAGPIGQFGVNEDRDHWVDRIKAVDGVYLGAVEESRLAAIYNLADVFVMPTRLFEMFGMAAVEAQACGKPVVASDSGGLREVVPPSCGARVAVGDFTTIANEIERLIDDSVLYASCAASAVANAARYDWARICATLDELYQGALSDDRRAS